MDRRVGDLSPINGTCRLGTGMRQRGGTGAHIPCGRWLKTGCAEKSLTKPGQKDSKILGRQGVSREIGRAHV